MSRDTAFVALGSNLGDRASYLARAREAIAAIPRSRLLAVSSIEETLPIGPGGQGNYLNQMVALETELSPRELLIALQEIERAAGRARGVRWGPRTLALDIVLYGDETVDEPGLAIPHPRAHERAFVLEPLLEIAPHLQFDLNACKNQKVERIA